MNLTFQVPPLESRGLGVPARDYGFGSNLKPQELKKYFRGNLSKLYQRPPRMLLKTLKDWHERWGEIYSNIYCLP